MAFCRAEGVRHEIIDTCELDIPGFVENPPDRCYHCKKELFGKLIAFAQSNGLAAVLEGSNMDDDGDYRPGRRAIRELGRDGARPSRFVHFAQLLRSYGRAAPRRGRVLQLPQPIMRDIMFSFSLKKVYSRSLSNYVLWYNTH